MVKENCNIRPVAREDLTEGEISPTSAVLVSEILAFLGRLDREFSEESNAPLPGSDPQK